MSKQSQTQLEQILAQADPKALEAIRVYEEAAPIYEEAMRLYQLCFYYSAPYTLITTDRTRTL